MTRATRSLIARKLSGKVRVMALPETTADLLRKLRKELSRMRALLIDRYPNARNSLRIMLSSMGVTAVHNAGSSAEVLRQVGRTVNQGAVQVEQHRVEAHHAGARRQANK